MNPFDIQKLSTLEEELIIRQSNTSKSHGH